MNGRNRTNPVEPLLQVDDTSDVARTVDLIRRLAGTEQGGVQVRIEPAVQWPFAWYLRELRVEYAADRLSADETAPVLLGLADPATGSRLADRYRRQILGYYRWTTWAQRLGEGDLRGLVRFMFHHDGWGTDQIIHFGVWVRKDLAA